jgi:hypothetical protein
MNPAGESKLPAFEVTKQLVETFSQASFALWKDFNRCRR